MSADQTRRELNNLDSEIAVLEKKRADLEQKEADKIRRINDIQKSITKNTSSSMLSSKNRQIQGYQNDIAKCSKEKAGITTRIAEKRKRQAEKAVKLRGEEAADKKKEVKAQKTIQQGYERRIGELTAQLNRQTAASVRAENFREVDDSEYDVFVSHAWEDKDSFVDEFVAELSALDVRVWYDKEKIAWGDSMRSRIDDGLAKSKFGVVLISPNYIADGKYWTKTELDGLFQLESLSGKTILPIWHNITKKEVTEYSPIIAGRRAMTTATMTPKEIATELQIILDSTNGKGQEGDLA
jgi:hypothetical protein